jgi:glycosyltransferase involved in cell wall biosynthesis
MTRVVIVQRRLVHYRVALFERLRQALAERGLHLDLVVGRPGAEDAVRQDGASLAWATEVKVHRWRLMGQELIWQPLPRPLRDCALLVVTQENKIGSNYWLQLTRRLRSRRLAFWGHGRNFQADAQQGWSERWKRFCLPHVDWWFAYTESSRRAVLEAGFAAERITVLNNAIDAEGFRRDCAAVSSADLADLRRQLAIGERAQVAIHCGSLYGDKRIDEMVAAGDQLARRLPDFHLLVLGAGPEAARIEAAAASRPWLHFLGMKKGVEKARAFLLAQVLLNPGAVGLHVVDSFVSGCPIVTWQSSRHGPEIGYLQDGVNAVVVVDDGLPAYVSAVAHLFETPPALERLGRQCREDSRIYSLDAMVANFADGIQRALA